MVQFGVFWPLLPATFVIGITSFHPVARTKPFNLGPHEVRVRRPQSDPLEYAAMWRVASQRAVQLWRDAEHLAELSSGSVCYETTIADLMNGQHSDPLRVVMFNTDTDRAEDVSHAIAQEILRRLGLEGRNVPSELEDFIDRHAGRDWPINLC